MISASDRTNRRTREQNNQPGENLGRNVVGTKFEGNQNTQGYRCFRCGNPGHFSRECPVRGIAGITCFGCGKKGHYASMCRQRVGDSDPSSTRRRDYGRFNNSSSENLMGPGVPRITEATIPRATHRQ